MSTDCYKQIYLQYAPMLIRFAEKFVSSFFAEDIVHDVFLKLWDKQIFILPDNEIKNILYASVRNACIDHLRHINLEQKLSDQRALQLKLDELEFLETSENLFMRKDMIEYIMKIVNDLPDKKREIFRMSYIEGLKAAEIAEKLNLSVRTVENQLYRILLILRKKLSSSFIYLFLYF
ncbi:MAG: RNA polymerase sigma-70 factor [Tannerellaceae bacterium]|nr:RNA polymerase sigma-70 factor [Tannerellaceae bacterium]